MLCHKCKCEGFIESSNMIVEGDESPNTATMVYQEAVFYCKNKNCSECDKEIGKTKTLIHTKTVA